MHGYASRISNAQFRYSAVGNKEHVRGAPLGALPDPLGNASIVAGPLKAHNGVHEVTATKSHTHPQVGTWESFPSFALPRSPGTRRIRGREPPSVDATSWPSRRDWAAPHSDASPS